ncbi:hypothetical protein ABZ917_27950 [Nonomuraea wenchangensis]
MTIGDFATTKVPGTFTVAYLVFNTIMNLTTQYARWEGWTREPFTGESTRHVSVWEKP